MTTYSFNLKLSETEAIMLQEALKMMMSHCETEIESGETAPFHAWLHSAREVNGRLFMHSEMTSTNSFSKD